MKRLIFLLLISICTISAYTYDFEYKGVYYKIVCEVHALDEVYYEVAVTHQYDRLAPTASYSGHIEIPSSFEVDGCKCVVTEIGYGAFYECALTSIDLPEGIIIGDIAFGKSELTEICLDGVNEIGGGAFANTSNLYSIEFPQSIKIIPRNLFSESKIKRVSIPASVEKIGLNAFDKCYDMSTFIIEDSATPLELDYDFTRAEYIATKPRNGYLYLGRDVTPTNVFFFAETAFETKGGFIKTVEIGPCVTSLPVRIFSEETSIEKINCYCVNPPKYIGKSVYVEDIRKMIMTEHFTKEVYENAVLYVPEGSLEAYKAHEVWGNFKNIVEGNITIGIDEIAQEDNHPKVYTKGMAIMVEGDNDAESVSVYSIDGRLVYAGKSDCIEVDAAGIYIVRIGNYTTKVIL